VAISFFLLTKDEYFMAQKNLTRMIQLAEEFFDIRNDPTQISVDGRVMAKLRRIHPSTMAEKRTKDGPVAWTLVIPTSASLMKQFIAKQINERELLKKNRMGETYDAIYLCSALVLPEYRGKGLARRLLVKAIQAIRKQYPIDSLFFWAFSPAGRKLAQSVAKEVGLPLFRRIDSQKRP
jgi:GNAT superfamily N-acetyltransferase